MNVCKACTCLVNGSAVTTCSTTVSSVQGAEVTTIEGLANGTPLQGGSRTHAVAGPRARAARSNSPAKAALLRLASARNL